MDCRKQIITKTEYEEWVLFSLFFKITSETNRKKQTQSFYLIASVFLLNTGHNYSLIKEIFSLIKLLPQVNFT